MVVGDKEITIQERQQLTMRADGDILSLQISPDGKYIAYQARSKNDKGRIRNRVSIIDTATNKYTVIFDEEYNMSLLNLDEELRPSPGDEVWVIDAPSFQWSPDSKSIALIAQRHKKPIDPEEEWLRERRLTVYSCSGKLLTSILVPRESTNSRINEFKWSPDSKRIALATKEWSQYLRQSRRLDIVNRSKRFSVTSFRKPPRG